MTTYHTYFPQIHHIQVPRLGAQIEGNVGTREQYLTAGRGYQTPVSWVEWEEKKGSYVEDARVLENYHRTLGLRHVPENHRLWQESWSSPPHHNSLIAYAQWICEVIDLLRPNAVELFNEPNVGYFAASVFHQYFGAWIWDADGPGDAPAAGILYRRMLEEVYTTVKALYPKVEIIAGALMANEHTEDFLRAFRYGPADAISFHLYLGADEPFEKLWYYIQKLRKITALPLILSETAVVATMDSDLLRDQQALYIQWIIDNWEELGLKRAVWYTLGDNGGEGNNGGWMCSDMNKNGVAYPVYHVFKEARI